MDDERASSPAEPSIFDLFSGAVRVGTTRIPVALLLLALISGAGAAGYVVHGHIDAPPREVGASGPRPMPSGRGTTNAATVVASDATIPSSAPTVPAKSSDEALERLKTLEKKPARDRTIEESVELARGHEQLGIGEVAELARGLDVAKPDKSTWVRLRDLARDDVLAADVLAAVAAHPTPAAADFLYDVVHDAHAAEPMRFLASDLLARPSLRAAASKPLTIALDLESAHACEAVRAVVERAKAEADERAAPLLGLLDKEKGCGKESKEDCFGCLRGSTLLFEAREAARGRAFSPQWALERP